MLEGCLGVRLISTPLPFWLCFWTSDLWGCARGDAACFVVRSVTFVLLAFMFVYGVSLHVFRPYILLLIQFFCSHKYFLDSKN